ncbi:MAG: translocation/assembly module TamB domain-containing protein [Acidobacteriaceae bacterium]|nr:translocation/assembly module TamB domain-containing protein [Acidobacteriaceae bacterium]
MRIRRRTVIAFCGALFSAAAICLLVVRTNWFETKLRNRVVALLDHATGAVATMDAVRFDLRTDTLELKNVALRVGEADGAPPFFAAPVVQAKLRLAALMRGTLDVESITIHRPQVAIVTNPDGSTNLPILHDGGAYRHLLNLGVNHFELDHGFLRLNEATIPFSARGETLKLIWKRRRGTDLSTLDLKSKGVCLQYGTYAPATADMDLLAQIAPDRFNVTGLSLRSGASFLHASGLISHFSRPSALFDVQVQAGATDLSRMGLRNIENGTVRFAGMASYEPTSGVHVSGNVNGKDVAFRAAGFTLRNVNLKSAIDANALVNISLHNLVVESPLAQLNGDGQIKAGILSLEAEFGAANIQRVALAAANERLPWSGVGSGHISLSASLENPMRDVRGMASIVVKPLTGGIPVSGELRASLAGLRRIVFENSHVKLPGTEFTFSGTPGTSLQISLTSSHAADLSPMFDLAGFHSGAKTIILLGPDAGGSFVGSLAGPLTNPVVSGDLVIRQFRAANESWAQVHSKIVFRESGLVCNGLKLEGDAARVQGNGSISLARWTVQPDSAVQVNAQFQNVNIDRLAAAHNIGPLPLASGTASGSADIAGTLDNPGGTAQLSISHLDAYGQRLNQVRLEARVANNEIQIVRGLMQAGPATLVFSGAYRHAPRTWTQGEISARLDSNGFPLRNVNLISRRLPELDAQLEAHGDVVVSISGSELRPVRADGTVLLKGIQIDGKPYGTVLLKTQTNSEAMTAALSGQLEGSDVHGAATVLLTRDLPLNAELQFGKLDLRMAAGSLGFEDARQLPVTGSVQGKVNVSGPLEDPYRWRSKVQLATVQMKPGAGPADLVFTNSGPVVLESDGAAMNIRSLHMAGKHTSLTAEGTIGLRGERALKLSVNGAVELRALGMLDSNLDASGESAVAAEITGPLKSPAINGKLQVKNGSFFLRDITNGLSAVNGTILFSRDRASIQSLTAESGGGTLRLGGFVSFGAAGPFLYGLTAHAEKVRLRYAGGVSLTGDADLRLTGSSTSSLLSGSAVISRVVLNANSDLGNLFATIAAPKPAPANQKDFVSGLHFDVSVESAPNLQLSTALSRDLETGVDVRLRGTPDHPILLGNVTVNQGDVKVFGMRYTINHGDVSFVNTAKIEPVLDVDLETETRGITVDITIAGPLNRLNITYRSDPPLQPRDIIALLAIGRAPSDVTSMQGAQVSTEADALQSSAYAVLGQAVSPTSSRLSKLFGITNIRIDPLVGGIPYNPQARLTLEQQISRDITVTYVTNLSQTAEQIFRVEWALNTQYSLVAIRDENGEFGIDFLYKKRFK